MSGLLDRLQRSVGGLVMRAPHQQMSRALVKTVLYRLLMVAITILVAFLVTGDTGVALSIGVASNVIKTGTYYGYERLWDRVAWGVSATDM